jgi:hypothetical protein
MGVGRRGETLGAIAKRAFFFLFIVRFRPGVGNENSLQLGMREKGTLMECCWEKKTFC